MQSLIEVGTRVRVIGRALRSFGQVGVVESRSERLWPYLVRLQSGEVDRLADDEIEVAVDPLEQARERGLKALLEHRKASIAFNAYMALTDAEAAASDQCGGELEGNLNAAWDEMKAAADTLLSLESNGEPQKVEEK